MIKNFTGATLVLALMLAGTHWESLLATASEQLLLPVLNEYQEEMPLSETIVQTSAEHSDKAVVVIGRTAGEDQDNSNTLGSYLLTEDEEKLLESICRHFDSVIVVLNTANIIDGKNHG